MGKQVIKYRPDIDGLRGFLIIIIAATHFFPNILSGGFSGVDIFFVISGYLISSITILKILHSKFSIVEFYKNRILRLFPALAFLLATALLFGFFVLTQAEYSQLGLHVFGGAFYISNFQYWQETGYFGDASNAKPLLHLWSLSIEEQFYLLYPLALLLLHKFLPYKRVIVILLICAFFSLGITIYLSFTHPIGNFFFPISRTWEFLAGGLLAYKEIFFGKNQLQKSQGALITNQIIGCAGFLLMTLGAFIISDHSRYPGVLTLFPVLGSIAFIYSNNSSFISHIFQSRFLIFFGLISYSLYLWHWTLLVFTRIATGSKLSVTYSAATILISICIAFLSYKYIEKPFRSSKNNHTWKIWFLLLSAIGITGLLIFRFNGVPSRIHTTDEMYNSKGEFTLGQEKILKCPTPIGVVDSRCFMNTNRPHVAILGDSHAGSLAHGFSEAENPSYSKFIALYAGNCHPTIDLDARCTKQSEYSLQKLKEFKSLDLIIITGNSSIIENDEHFTIDDYANGYSNLLKRLSLLTKNTIFIVDAPHLPDTPQNCGKFGLPLRDLMNIKRDICQQPISISTISGEKYRQFISKLKDQNPELVIYNPDNIFYSQGIIKIQIENKLLFSDSHHLSDYGSKLLVDNLLKNLSEKH